MKRYQKSLFIFRRDLRLNDNTALLAALESSQAVIPSFIFDPRQIKDNPYKSDFCVQFMVESLFDLSQQLKKHGARLFIFYGEAGKIIPQLIEKEKINAVFLNRDYTLFSIHRDLGIKHICEKAGAGFETFGDCLLNEPEDIQKDDGGVYSVYSHFLRKSQESPVRPVKSNALSNYYTKGIPLEDRGIYEKLLKNENKSAAVKGGRQEALKILNSIKKFKDHDKTRNIPGIEGTTKLSAHNKFGTCSVREVYHAVEGEFGKGHTLIRELYWRDFFTHVGFHHPFVLGEPFNRKYDKIPWSRNEKHFEAWCNGKTGFPIVDAGMRELNGTGFMHNRVRMITASFLVKDLHIDWRWGEKYFAQKLVDYDPLVNNGNWQWAASTGCDAQPYFRIFNPWLQQKRFDPDCIYIKKWVPELRPLTAKQIHSLEKEVFLASDKYPIPIVDHSVESRIAKMAFAKV